jgi:hypothetical protein
MTPLKTIVATAVIAVGGTVAAFSGLHIGQPNADAAGQAVKAKTTYTVTLTAKQLAQLMHGQSSGATHQVRHHQRHAVRYQNNGSSSGRSYNGSRSYGSGSYSGHSNYRCYNNGGSHSGSWGGGSHSGSGGGCW